jgi:SET domain-containing protein
MNIITYIILILVILLYSINFNQYFTKEYILYKDKSNIHGIGLFTKQNLKKGQSIGILSIKQNNKYKDTQNGRYINHSYMPNIHIIKSKLGKHDIIVGISKYNIPKNTELTCDYSNPIAPPNFIKPY